MDSRPRINEQFPVGHGLSPPVIDRPIPACAEAVFVSGFIPHAVVRVYSNTSELLATKSPAFGFAEITLNRRVKLGESITATQTVLGITSGHSIQPVVVSAAVDSEVTTTKPDVGDTLYQCGIVVPVGNLVPGVRVHVFEDGIQIGNEPTAATWHPTLTKALHANGHVTAQQISCEGTSHEVKGPLADPVTVKPAPSPVPAPQVDPNSMIVQGDTVTLTGLLVGAGVEIFAGANKICSGWYATGDANYFPVSPPLTGDPVTATQKLCNAVSSPSAPATPSGRLLAPVVLDPICKGARFVVLRGTTINANVVVMRNGTIVGYGGAAPGDVILALGGNQALSTGDVVTAIQYMGSTVSPLSNAVTVVSSLSQPSIEILGGEPFFLPKAGEQPIDGAVFPRGRGSGPVIRMQACCSREVRIKIFGPKGELVSQPAAAEVFPGYFTAALKWTSFASAPGDIPVGKYTVAAHSACSGQDANVPFYVIFNPDDVGGPPRFSFDDTAVWFAAQYNGTFGKPYYLRQSDIRVFSIALNAVSSMTDPYDAAIAVSRAEENLFAYSLNYHTNDVLDMILHYTAAQCADDASCLTSLLRAVGIPAHNVTADASIETGKANWNFDTWVEFLAAHENKIEWRILHPHQYPGMLPESRDTFGAIRGVATNVFNDIVIMANENWDISQLDDGVNDVVFGRNACGQPNQIIYKAPWIDELCESGYWSTPHWDCSGASSRSFRSGRGFRIDESNAAFGHRLTGTFQVVNRHKARDFGTVTLEVVSSLPESKQFPDERFDSKGWPAALDPGDSLDLPFDVQLPETVKAGHELYLWAHQDGHTIERRRIAITPGISCELTSPKAALISYLVGEEASVVVKVTNLTSVSQHVADVELKAPFALSVENAHRQCFDLKPCESRESSWTVRAVAALSGGSFHVSVATAKAGSVKLQRRFKVVGEQRPLTVSRPGFRP